MVENEEKINSLLEYGTTNKLKPVYNQIPEKWVELGKIFSPLADLINIQADTSLIPEFFAQILIIFKK